MTPRDHRGYGVRGVTRQRWRSGMTGEVREVLVGNTSSVAAAILELRQRWEDATSLVEFVDETLRPAGFRLVAVFGDGDIQARSVAGFRLGRSLTRGKYLYVDDLTTLPGHRGAGYAYLLMMWLF